VCLVVHVLRNLALTHTDVLATRVRIVKPLDAAEAGPSSLAERPVQSTKGKGKATKDEAAWNNVSEGEAVGLLDKQWAVRQHFLVDRILKKHLEIEALFREVATLEGMMEDM
jgi:hypothetical protein